VSEPPAGAALAGKTTPTSTVSSGEWGATPTASSVTSAPNCQTAPSSCIAFTASGAGNPWRAFFDVWNTGTETLKGLSYQISLSGGVAPTVALTACPTAWNTTTGSCSGATTAVLAASAAGTYAVAAGVPAAPGAEAYLRATVNNNATAVAISTLVAPSQVATATTNH
jgi:hypothetical protein